MLEIIGKSSPIISGLGVADLITNEATSEEKDNSSSSGEQNGISNPADEPGTIEAPHFTSKRKSKLLQIFRTFLRY